MYNISLLLVSLLSLPTSSEMPAILRASDEKAREIAEVLSEFAIGITFFM
jgi:hypothetical protein